MLYDVKTSAEYLDALEDDWRKEKLLELRKLIQTAGPDLIEGIQYKMLSYGDGTKTVFHLNAQKNYVSLYVGDTTKIDKEGELLQGIDRGKGCLRFKKSTEPAKTGIAEFIGKTIRLWNAGEDVDC
jgi:uncharacterized protein YdhG (YjbR/CyaY superfamily)